MSEHWEMYPCEMGDHVAFVTYDHGIGDSLQALPLPDCLRVRIDLQHPNENGLPGADEAAVLNQIEDAFIAAIPAGAGVSVGRITTNGRRYLMFYVAIDAGAVAAIRDRISDESGYAIGTAQAPDPEREAYWQELFPTDDDWQVVQDIRVEEALRREGDPLTAERPIDHWAFFPTAAARQAFVDGLGEESIVVDTRDDGSEAGEGFVAQLQTQGLPDYRSMMKTTIPLRRAAESHGGRYDGWECPVCKDSSPG